MDARVNVNFLGEAVLGENEAARRLEQCLEALALPEVGSVIDQDLQLSTHRFPRLAFNHTVEVLCSRLGKLFRAAAEQNFVRPNGDRVPKFVYLDMEEYRDHASQRCSLHAHAGDFPA